MRARIYEQPDVLAQYLHFHYAERLDYLPWQDAPERAADFPRRCAALLLAEMANPDKARVLDLGCAVGRATLELSARCAEVEGLDASASFITAAQRIAEQGELAYEFILEGSRSVHDVARRPRGARPERVCFRVGDACDLPLECVGYDGVLMANLLCRLPRPARCLEQMGRVVKPGGVVVITTPCSWSVDFTPPDQWLCTQGSTLEGIERILTGDFVRRKVLDMPMLIREHARKYQWTVTQASVWERRSE